MCDTMVAVGRATKDGKIIFAKNSDRDSNEAQLLIRYPRRKYDLRLNPVVKTTYLEIPQAAETYDVILSRPAWMWGCEMGFNEFGVVIGNEAVFNPPTERKAGADRYGYDSACFGTAPECPRGAGLYY